MVTVNDSENKLAALRSSCKRGILDLELMLQNFCDDMYLSLKPEQRNLFEELLRCSDQDLQDWLLGSKPAANPKLQDLILVIRHMHAIA